MISKWSTLFSEALDFVIIFQTFATPNLTLRTATLEYQPATCVSRAKCYEKQIPLSSQTHLVIFQLNNQLIHNFSRCPVEDPSLIIESNGNGLRSKFQIKMFKFIGEELNDVWLHCTVRACNATNPDNCIPVSINFIGNSNWFRSERPQMTKIRFLYF